MAATTDSGDQFRKTIFADLNAFTSSSSTNFSYQDYLDEQLYVSYIIDLCVSPILYVVGAIGNLISAMIWIRRRGTSSAIYLAAMSINDSLFLLLHAVLEANRMWSIRTIMFPAVCEIFASIFMATQYFMTAIVLGFTAERFIAVRYPLLKIKICTAKRALKVVTVLIAVCLLLAGLQLHFWKYDSMSMSCFVPAEVESAFVVWSWITEMVFSLVVPLVILVINILVMREIRLQLTASMKLNAASPAAVTGSGSGGHGENGSDACRNTATRRARLAATNAVLLTVSFYLILTTLPVTLVYLVNDAFPMGDKRVDSRAVMSADPVWRRFIVFETISIIVNEFCMSHAAAGVLLFAASSSEFRRAVFDLFRRCLRTRQRQMTVGVRYRHTTANQ